MVEEAPDPGLGRGIKASTLKSKGPAPVSIQSITEVEEAERMTVGIAEVDRVLGGGLTFGSMVLLGGEPGVGKSTLLAQMMQGASENVDAPLLYVSGEESVSQAGMRAKRVGARAANLHVLAETNVEKILGAALDLNPAMLAIDSIQTMHTDRLDSIPGAVGQIRECASMLLSYAKEHNVPTVLVGHVTKEGSIAGPKTLEHVVDTVLQFEGEGASPFRLLRASKNRFGSTQEIGVFEMRSSGLSEVTNPSELFLAERPINVPGSVVVASAEGNRPILVEIQALIAAASAGTGRRTSAGFDGNRVSLLLAVLERHAGLDMIGQDVFVNVAGGLKLSEPAADVGVLLALASSTMRKALDSKTLAFGEVGLAGEIRAVNVPEIRLAEAQKLGFERCILPEANRARLESKSSMELIGVKSVQDALDVIA